MTDASQTSAERQKLGSRLGSSPKLLARKALERASEILGDGETLEASFPQPPEAEVPAQAAASATDAEGRQDSDVMDVSGAAADQVMLSETAGGGSVTPTATPAAQGRAPAPAWSEEDESALQALLAARKAAGYQRRGRDVGGQRIMVGMITPNPNTVVAVIVGIVAEHHSIERAKLVDAMAAAEFPHAKAQPTDKGWCQGYVAGAIRQGFLALSEQTAVVVAVA